MCQIILFCVTTKAVTLSTYHSTHLSYVEKVTNYFSVCHIMVVTVVTYHIKFIAMVVKVTTNLIMRHPMVVKVGTGGESFSTNFTLMRLLS